MKIHFSVNGIEMTSDLEKYANKKVARLSRRVPRRLRVSTDCHIMFTQAVRKGVKYNTCDIVLSLDGNELRTRETTQHMYAALDIAAVQIEQQLKDLDRRDHVGLIRRHFRTS